MERTLNWSVLILGIWLVISPWILGFYAINLALISDTIVGVLLVTIVLWQIFGE